MDSFQIAMGYWEYYCLWNSGGLTARDRAKTRSISQQLSRLKFEPGMTSGYAGWRYPFRENDSMGEPGHASVSERDEWGEAFDVYISLVEKWESPAAAMFECYELQRHFYIGGSDVTIQQAIQLIDPSLLGIRIDSGHKYHGTDAVRYDHDFVAETTDDGEFMPFLWASRMRGQKQLKLVLNWQQCFIEAWTDCGMEQRWPMKIGTNCLDHVSCPCCGNRDEFHIQVQVWEQVNDDGTDGPIDSPDWDYDSEAFCVNCRQYGQLRDFKIDDSIRKQLKGETP
jgi:hypothetical protein